MIPFNKTFVVAIVIEFASFEVWLRRTHVLASPGNNHFVTNKHCFVMNKHCFAAKQHSFLTKKLCFVAKTLTNINR